MTQPPTDTPNHKQHALSGLRRIAGNVLSLFSSDIVTRATSYAIYVLIARNLGVHEFGQMALALTLFQTFQWLAIVGLETFITREIAQDRSKTNDYLVNSGIIVVVFSILSTLGMIGFAVASKYSEDTVFIISLLALGLLPYALSVICDAVFKGWEQMHHIIIANTLVNAIKVGAVFYLFWQGQGLFQIAFLITLCYVALFLVKAYLLSRFIIKPLIRFDISLSLRMTRSAMPFMGVDILAAVMTSMGVLWLSQLAIEADVGVYTAAGQLMVPISLAMQSLVVGTFPTMCRHFERGVYVLRQTTEQLFEFIVACTLPVVLGIYLFSDHLLLLLYDSDDFLLASSVVQITVWLVMFRLLAKVLGDVLMASNQERTNFRILAVNFVLGMLLFPIMITQWGLVGVAVAQVVVSGVNFLQHLFPVLRLFNYKMSLLGAIGRPALAGVCMIICGVLVSAQPPLVAFLSAGGVYVAVLALTTLWSVGGPQRLREQYLSMRAEEMTMAEIKEPGS
jgi:O-antigen/teichoic acid export membrane protein